MTYKLTASQTGKVVTLRITTEQLSLLGDAASHYVYDMEGPEEDARVKEMTALAKMCYDAANNPGDEGTIHGFAL